MFAKCLGVRCQDEMKELQQKALNKVDWLRKLCFLSARLIPELEGLGLSMVYPKKSYLDGQGSRKAEELISLL